MNRKISSTALLLAFSIWTASCHLFREPFSIVVVSGNAQSTNVNTEFGSPLVVQVLSKAGRPVHNAAVTFTPPSSGASATTTNTTILTDLNGKASSGIVTANGTNGSYQVDATVIGVSEPAVFNLTNTGGAVTENFVFYATGQGSTVNTKTSPTFYAIAGVVTIETSGPNPGTVMGGEQDYNDGDGVTAENPITGGTLTVDSSTGLGTLTLVTGNDSFGGVEGDTPAGTEEFAVSFSNADHALIIQWDGTGTSSGSIDLQTATGTPNGTFSFTLSGVDTEYCPVVSGGVFTITTGSFTGGTFDFEDPCVGEGTASTGNSFPAGITVTAPDALGRGSINNVTGIATTIVFYVVGPEVARIIDTDTTDSGVGSAFGQGDNSFSDSSLGTFVFEDVGNLWNGFSDAEGALTAHSDGATMSGVADLNEGGDVFSAESIPTSGTSYSIAANGYGDLMFLDGAFGEVTQFGIYMTDPSLNLNDPNNTSPGQGALIVDLSEETLGAGVIVPQGSTSPAAFAGSYAFGMQEIESENFEETDFAGQGSVAANALNGTGYISDPFGNLGDGSAVFSGATFTGTATPDGANPGRFLMETKPLAITPPEKSAVDFVVAVYQASGGSQLFWLDEDDADWFMGPLEQQGAVVTPLQAAGAIVKPHSATAQKK